MTWLWVILLAVVALLAYVRLAPIDAAAVHQPVKGDCDKDGEGFCLRVIGADAGALARVDAVMRELPRTQAIAGSPSEGRISYVTRSKVIGFPDFTTVEQTEAQIRLYARLRFGRSDFGVNRARLEQVLRSVVSD